MAILLWRPPDRQMLGPRGWRLRDPEIYARGWPGRMRLQLRMRDCAAFAMALPFKPSPIAEASP